MTQKKGINKDCIQRFCIFCPGNSIYYLNVPDSNFFCLHGCPSQLDHTEDSLVLLKMHQSKEDNLDGDRNRNSSGGMTRNSESSSKSQSGDNKKRNGKRSPASNRARTRRRDASHGDRNSGSYYSEDYENSSASGCSLSASSHSLSPVPRSLAPTKRVSSSPLRKPGMP